MKENPETGLKLISAGYGIFSLGFIGIAVILFPILDWQGFEYFAEDIWAMSDIAAVILIGFLFSAFLCIGSWNLLKMNKPAQYSIIASAVGVAGLLLLNILPQWIAWLQGDIPKDVGLHQMLSSSGFPVGYAYLAAMLVITYKASNNSIKSGTP